MFATAEDHLGQLGGEIPGTASNDPRTRHVEQDKNIEPSTSDTEPTATRL